MRKTVNQLNTASSARTMCAASSVCLYAVRFFAYCFFYYFGYMRSTEYSQRMQTLAA